YFGICAGGYLPCTNIVWAGARYRYPVRLVDGTASGPVPGLVPYPESQSVKLDTGPAIYAGGSSFDVKGARVLARYPNGTAAAVAVKHGKGRLVLTGAHVEFTDGKDDDLLAEFAKGHKAGDGKTFKAIWRALEK
ncbi:MAG: BPL-N domain-containing protein, partial [Thiotrichales bacterium]|nr:BPL-N domain-containing protein [Thiotrichales bacterium]